MLIAQVTDFHLHGTEADRERLQRIASVLSNTTEPIDLVIVSGDIVQAAPFEDDQARAVEEYRIVHGLFSGIAPLAWCPGNADGGAYSIALEEHFPDATGTAMRVDNGDVTVLMLDSRVEGELRGHLDDTALAWLDNELAGTTNPALIVLHHPPVEFGHPVFDTLKLDNADALETVIRNHPQVIGTLFGHTHTAIAAQFAGRPAFGAPGVHSSGQLPWDIREGAPLIDPTAPPAYAMHRVDANGITSIPVVLH